MKVGDLVAYKGLVGNTYGLILEQDYDLSPPVRGIKFLVKWLDRDATTGDGCGWYRKESLEVISESR